MTLISLIFTIACVDYTAINDMDLADIAGNDMTAKGLVALMMEVASLAADDMLAKSVLETVGLAKAHEKDAVYADAVFISGIVSETVATAIGLAVVKSLAAAWREAKLVEMWSTDGLPVRNILFPTIYSIAAKHKIRENYHHPHSQPAR